VTAALQYWWQESMEQKTSCHILTADVVREGESQMVTLTLHKSEPSAFAQDSAGKSWMHTEKGAVIPSSAALIPNTWWHVTGIENFADILRDSLQAGPAGKLKAVYSFAGPQPSKVHGGQVVFEFCSSGMVTNLGKGDMSEVIPEGLIGFFDSSKGRQWLHHKNNVQLIKARVEYHTFCNFFSEVFTSLPKERKYSPELHTALANIAALVVPASDKQYVDDFDFDSPHKMPC